MFPRKPSSPRWEALATVSLMVALSYAAGARAEPLNLESAVERALQVAPEIRAADADVAARAGELRQARSWPNPTVEARADNKLGQETGTGGTAMTQLALSQPLPILRLPRERRVAEARLAAAEASRNFRRLQIERDTAQAFFAAQLAQTRLALARERLDQTGLYPDGRQRRDPLKRYLTPFDRARLALLREEANQTVASAGREHATALAELRARLALPAAADVELADSILPDAPPVSDPATSPIDNHPAIAAAQRAQEGAVAGISAARAQRFADPVLNLFRERDFLNDARRDVTGVGVSVQVPLWNLNRGPIERAQAEAARAQAELDVQRREIALGLARSQAELARLRAQAEQVRDSLLEPARRLHELAQRSFHTGEVNVLALIDAANTYYDARARYLELLAQAQLAAAELRLAAGRSVVGEREVQP
mgnify:CR=1 FL=1